jgi:hypothetical protein
VRIRTVQLELTAFGGRPADALALLQYRAAPPMFTAEQTAALEAFLQARESAAPADIDRALGQMRNLVQRGALDPNYLFKALVAFGRLDEAFAMASRWSNLGGASAGSLFDPSVAAVRRDARFWPLAARLGLIRYWRTRGVWPDFCSEPGLPYDCATEAARASPPARSARG